MVRIRDLYGQGGIRGGETAVPDAAEVEHGSESLSTVAGPGLAAHPSPLAAEWWGPHRGSWAACVLFLPLLPPQLSLCYMPPDLSLSIGSKSPLFFQKQPVYYFLTKHIT